MSIKFVMIDRIKRVEHKIVKKWLRGSGDKAEFEDESQGYWATFESCPASIYLGASEPRLADGDRVRLTLERA